MRNIKPHAGNSFDFYKKVLKSKRDKDLKIFLAPYAGDIEKLYQIYDDNFNSDSLALLKSRGFSEDECTNLKELYKYSAKAFVDLRTELTTTENGREVHCQYCTLGITNTFDHFVPQEEFAEFTIHPRNLHCCCSQCNSKKSNFWRDNDKTLFLNLYKDILPEDQYLFAIIKVDDKAVTVEFKLENNTSIDTDMFALIETHYNKMNLFERFIEVSDGVISRFLSDLKAFDEPILSVNSLKVVKKQIESERNAMGRNYWQSILKLALLECEDFMNLLNF
jgi:hypothetical protein